MNGQGERPQFKEYDPRWFVCESCRFVFSIPLVDAPYSLSTVACPACQCRVSCKIAGT